ncbi:MAG: 4'-phosphopantetheinyl transferase family protein [Paludibacteraceae bacterium]
MENNLSVAELIKEFNHPELYLPEMDKINTEQRKKELLGLRLALKYCLGGEEKIINHAPDGKPVLTDESYKISFSHSKNWISVIAHPTFEVGIDIERPTEQIFKIHTRFLGSEELQDYQRNNDQNYLRVVWSTKEALYKIIGESAYNFARQIRILPFELKQEGELKALFLKTEKQYLVSYRLTDDYTLAYCVDNG